MTDQPAAPAAPASSTGVMPGRPSPLRHVLFVEGDQGMAAGLTPAPATGGLAGAIDAASTPAAQPAAVPVLSTTPVAVVEPAPSEWDGKVDSLPKGAQDLIRELRGEAATRRTALTAAEQRQQDTIRALAKAAGIEVPDDGAAPAPADVTEKVEAANARAREAQVELGVYRIATAADAPVKVDVGALLDSRAFVKATSDLDPEADDFADKVRAAIASATTANPKLLTAQAATRSGADFTGGTGGERDSRTPRTLTDAVAGAYGT